MRAFTPYGATVQIAVPAGGAANVEVDSTTNEIYGNQRAFRIMADSEDDGLVFLKWGEGEDVEATDEDMPMMLNTSETFGRPPGLKYVSAFCESACTLYITAGAGA